MQCPADGAPYQFVETLPKDTRLGAYRIDRVLGEGGMGFVYEANHEVLRRRTAMKFLRPEYASVPDVVARFTQEAQAVNLVDHENIVNVYDQVLLDRLGRGVGTEHMHPVPGEIGGFAQLEWLTRLTGTLDGHGQAFIEAARGRVPRAAGGTGAADRQHQRESQPAQHPP
jgi:hypothetical protein